jgi:uncharacterized protein (TIGR00369 family)
MIWHSQATPKLMNERSKNTMADFLEITFTEVGDDFIKAEMPITEKVKQPLGIMNGGASCVMAETAGSTAANYAVDNQKQYCVGLDINTNHLRPISNGKANIIAYPIHIGRSTHVWGIEIFRSDEKMISISRLTLAVKDRQ